MEPDKDTERLLTQAQVADIFRVTRKSVWRWAKAGKLPFTLTPSGRRRYRESDVRALIEGAS